MDTQHKENTVTPNKRRFDLRKWRGDTIDKRSAPAKRFLTTVESIVITIALIASLGIASPLMASGVEPSPEAAVGVIGQDEATGIDADECVESEDGGDLECATTTAPGSSSNDGEGSGSGDSANAGGVGTGGANGGAADSAGTGDASDVDDADADDAVAADASDAAENDADKESGKDGDEKSDNADASKSDEAKKTAKAEATTPNTFESDGGQLNSATSFLITTLFPLVTQRWGILLDPC